MEITRTTYSGALPKPQGEPFQVKVKTLNEAISAAIKYASEPNPENYNACCLRIDQDGIFWILERCYANTSYSSFKEDKAHYNLTVPATAYPAQAWPFHLMEFCSYFGIRVSTRQWTDLNDKVRSSVWDRIESLQLELDLTK